MGGSISLSRVSTLRVDFHIPESRFQYTLLFMFRPLSSIYCDPPTSIVIHALLYLSIRIPLYETPG